MRLALKNVVVGVCAKWLSKRCLHRDACSENENLQGKRVRCEGSLSSDLDHTQLCGCTDAAPLDFVLMMYLLCTL